MRAPMRLGVCACVVVHYSQCCGWAHAPRAPCRGAGAVVERQFGNEQLLLLAGGVGVCCALRMAADVGSTALAVKVILP